MSACTALERLAEIAQIEEAACRRYRWPAWPAFRANPRASCWWKTAAPGKHGVAGGRADAGIAAGNLRHQAARIHGVDGDVGAIRGIGGGAQLRAIVFAGLGDAAGELDHRFFAGDVAEQVGHGFERGELAIGVENVEFGFVGGEGRVGVFGDGGLRRRGGGVGQSGELRFLAGKQRVHGPSSRSRSLVKSETT